MQKKETAIEVKVGALVIFSLGLLVAFVLVLGDFSFSRGYEVHVEFQNAGGLKPGGDVAIAGMNVGTVRQLQFRRNEADLTINAVMVRATLSVQSDYASSIRQDSQFYITTRGVLGEPYIEIVTPNPSSPTVPTGAVLRGVDPPRMDIIISEATRLLTMLTDLLGDPNVTARDLMANASAFFKLLAEIVQESRAGIGTTIENVSKTADEAAKMLAALNVTVGDGKEVEALFTDLRGAGRDLRRSASYATRIAGRVDNALDPLLNDGSATLRNAREVSDTAQRLIVSREANLGRALDNIEQATQDLTVISADTRVLVQRVKDGEGTVGKLMQEREIYDDLKEIMRQIKQRPWKIIWKE